MEEIKGHATKGSGTRGRGVDKDTLWGRQNLAECLTSMGLPPRGLATLRDVDPDGDFGDWWRYKSPWNKPVWQSEEERLPRLACPEPAVNRGSHFLGPERAERGSHVTSHQCYRLKGNLTPSHSHKLHPKAYLMNRFYGKRLTPEKQGTALSYEPLGRTFWRQEGNWRQWPQ